MSAPIFADIFDPVVFGGSGGLFSSIFDAQIFEDAAAQISTSVYRGALVRSQVYRGTLSDAQIYKGAGILFQP